MYIGLLFVISVCFILLIMHGNYICSYNAKQKHLGCKKVRGQSEAACKQADATKSFDIS